MGSNCNKSVIYPSNKSLPPFVLGISWDVARKAQERRERMKTKRDTMTPGERTELAEKERVCSHACVYKHT